MKINFNYAAAIAVMVLSAFITTSCNDNDENGVAIISTNLCTAEVDLTNHYRFYTDDDIVVEMDNESNSVLFNTFGSKAERVSLIYQYRDVDATVVNGVRHVSNAQVLNGTQLIDIENITTKASAEAKNQLATDSIFEVSTIESFYAHKGYLNCIIKAPYAALNNKAVYPGITLFADQSDIKENEMTLHLYYNCHAPKNALTGYLSSFAKSYPLSMFANRIPGTDDITLKLIVEGQSNPKTKTFKMTRSDFFRPF